MYLFAVPFLVVKVFISTTLLLAADNSPIASQHLHEIFKQFIIQHNRSYSGNSTEYAKRFHSFELNVEKANRLNADYGSQGKPSVFGINKFSDWTVEEFNDLYLSGYRPKTSSLKFESMAPRVKPLNTTGLPKKVDWRTKRMVTAIKNQGTCGACWGFSIAEVMESMLSIQFHVALETLSVQELIDCDTFDDGCQGGDICSSAHWASLYGIVREKYYPLKDKTNPCKFVPYSVPRVMIHDYKCKSYVNHEDELLSLLTHGPVSVAVDAKTWHSYVQGIIQFHCSAFVNHAVTIVGYDLTGEVPFYIVRNSWGQDFGDQGYLYVKIGNNLCGIAGEVVSLTVDLPAR